jgi:hypothetical protein
MSLEDQMRQAVARGWCHAKNADKVLDPDLVEAIVAEVLKSLEAEDDEECPVCGIAP